MTAAAAATTAAGLAAEDAAFVPPPTESPSQHPGAASGAAEVQIRQPGHPGAVASVRARSLCSLHRKPNRRSVLKSLPQSQNPRSVKMTFRGSDFIFHKSNEFSVRSD